MEAIKNIKMVEAAREEAKRVLVENIMRRLLRRASKKSNCLHVLFV